MLPYSPLDPPMSPFTPDQPAAPRPPPPADTNVVNEGRPRTVVISPFTPLDHPPFPMVTSKTKDWVSFRTRISCLKKPLDPAVESSAAPPPPTRNTESCEPCGMVRFKVVDVVKIRGFEPERKNYLLTNLFTNCALTFCFNFTSLISRSCCLPKTQSVRRPWIVIYFPKALTNSFRTSIFCVSFYILQVYSLKNWVKLGESALIQHFLREVAESLLGEKLGAGEGLLPTARIAWMPPRVPYTRARLIINHGPSSSLVPHCPCFFSTSILPCVELLEARPPSKFPAGGAPLWQS